MNAIFVRPIEGRLVRRPETGEILPPDGMSVPRDSYWIRRVREGDVEECEAPKAATPPRVREAKEAKEAKEERHGDIV